MAGEERRSKEKKRNMEEETWESEIKDSKERIKGPGGQVHGRRKSPGKEDKEAHERIDKLENDIAKDRAERQEFERNVEGKNGIQDAEDFEKDMEKRLARAMEQVKILNLDFGKDCADRKTLIKEAISWIKEKVTEEEKEEFEKIMKEARVDILGKSMIMKETGKGRIHKVPILITCGCKNAKERLDVIVRKAGLVAEGMHGVCGQGS
jgi:hypothetical protein